MYKAQHGRCLGLLTVLVQLMICFYWEPRAAAAVVLWSGWAGVGDLNDDMISSPQKKHRLDAIRVELQDDST